MLVLFVVDVKIGPILVILPVIGTVINVIKKLEIYLILIIGILVIMRPALLYLQNTLCVDMKILFLHLLIAIAVRNWFDSIFLCVNVKYKNNRKIDDK